MEEIESYCGVDSARARLIGDPDSPVLAVTVALEETADLAALRRRTESEALDHTRTALENPALPARLNLTVTTRRSAGVA